MCRSVLYKEQYFYKILIENVKVSYNMEEYNFSYEFMVNYFVFCVKKKIVITIAILKASIFNEFINFQRYAESRNEPLRTYRVEFNLGGTHDDPPIEDRYTSTYSTTK